MGFLDELEQEEEEERKAAKLRKEATDDQEMQYTKSIRTMRTDAVRTKYKPGYKPPKKPGSSSTKKKKGARSSSEKETRATFSSRETEGEGEPSSYRLEIKKKKGRPQLTVNAIANRVMKVPLLQLIFLLIVIGMGFTFLYAASYYSMWKDDGPSEGDLEDRSFIYKYADDLATFFYYITAIVIIYFYLSVQYRKRFKKTADGTKMAIVPSLPKKPGKKMVAILSSSVPILMLLFLVCGIYRTMVFMDYSGDDFDMVDGYKKLFVGNLFHVFILAFVPLSLLFLTAGTPRGMKKTGKYLSSDNPMLTFLVLATVLAIVSFAFYFMLVYDHHKFWKGLMEGEHHTPSEMIMNYFFPIGNIVLLFVFSIAAFVLLNLKSKKKGGYDLEFTPAIFVFLAGAGMLLVKIIINLTVFNTDFEYDGEVLGWWVFQYVLSNLGLFFVLAGMTLLMVEYTLARRMKPTKLCLMPDQLWGEMVKKNYIFRKLF